MEPQINWIAIVVAALIPMVLGFIYYGPLFQKQWLSSMGKTQEEMEPTNPAVTYGLALLVAFMISASLKMMLEFMHKDVNQAGEMFLNSTHTFGHGAFHGMFLCLSFVVPVIISLSLFHKSSAKNILLNVVFWTLCFAVMGGILDAWV